MAWLNCEAHLTLIETQNVSLCRSQCAERSYGVRERMRAGG